jgi:4-amino-4-deoxy-L-arabinose transferase-like glycosyltransferase
MLWVGVLIYAGIRLALLPAGDITARGFSHDSAYVILLADNLVAGRGYVSDAHWLVFLNPERLPMPFHNANPLYPALIAGVALLTGTGTVVAGFAVSALASVLLFGALLFLLGEFVPSRLPRLLLALAGTVFSPVFESSLRLLPDALAVALTVAFLACAVPARSIKGDVLGGVLFGLAWLTRSSAVLVLPGVFVYFVLRAGWKKALARSMVIGVTSLAVCSPWLVHTAEVWGNPFRSDAMFYLLQDYHAQLWDGSADRYWHATEAPPSLGELVRREPAALARFWLEGVPRSLYALLRSWSYSSRPSAVLLAVLLVFSAWRLFMRGRSSHRAELIGAAVIGATIVLTFAIRSRTFEMRYYDLLAMLAALMLLFGVFDAARHVRTGGPWRALYVAALAAGVFFWFGVVPAQNVRSYTALAGPDTATVDYVALARRVDERFGKGEPVVVGDYPYFYTLATAAPSLSIPESSDAYLLEYMKTHGARYVLLTREELRFWRPRWNPRDALPPWLVLAADWENAYVLERKEPP